MYHHPNNHVYIHARKANEKRHQWVYDEHSKTIKSVYEIDKQGKNIKNHRSLDSRSGHLTVQLTDSRYYQMWTYADSGHLYTDKSRDTSNQYFAVVQGNHDSEGRAAYRETSRKTTGDNWYQLWDIVYVDVAPNLEEGFAEEWGMWINRPFHIVSEFGENRFLDLVSNRGVIKTRNGRDTQVYRFDMKFRTIKSKGYSTAWSHSLDMRNKWMYVYGTGSQWHQLFRYNSQNKQVYNQNGKVLDIQDNKDQEGAYVGT
jgi:hypothetical protein